MLRLPPLRLSATPLAAVLAASALLASRSARADDLPSINLRGFTPSTDPSASLFLEPTATPGPWNFNTAGWLSYAYRPLVLRDAGGAIASRVISNQASFDATAGLGLGTRAAIGLAIPVVLGQGGDDNALSRQALGGARLPAQALGDVAVTGKVNLVPVGDLGGFGLAALARITAPTGARTSGVGDGAATSELRALAEMRLVAVSVEATAGYKVRVDARSFGGKTWRDQLPWGLGLFVKPQAFGLDPKGRWQWGVEGHGELPVGPDAPFTSVAQSPTYVGASARYGIGDASVLVGAESGVTHSAGAAPFRGVVNVAWAPRVHDQDHDGVPDDVDECVGLAEDRDGFQDSDGCPELDNDDDGVLDTEDACPNVAGVESDDPKKNGCPDPDLDKDGIPNELDACPKKAGPRSEDPAKNGCPNPDRDGDGIPNKQDACPDAPGVPSVDPKTNGCPPA